MTINADYIGTAAPRLVVTDLRGGSIPTTDLWQSQPVLLFFLRHFGCALCRSHLRLLAEAFPRFAEQGVSMAVITFADARSASFLQYTQGVNFPILLDQTRRVYHAFGMVDGRLSDAIHPRILIEQLRQIPGGHMPYIAPGANLTQLGGSVIIDTAGTIRFHHLALPIDFYPTIEQYMAAIRSIKTGHAL